MTRFHRPELHLAERFAAAFEHALHHNEPGKPQERLVPPASDWDDWHWEDQR